MAKSVKPKSFGNGVYLFKKTGEEFAKSLSVFLEKHNGVLKLKAMTPNYEQVPGGVEGLAMVTGYFVCFKLKENKDGPPFVYPQ